jgi:hypothetical protein
MAKTGDFEIFKMTALNHSREVFYADWRHWCLALLATKQHRYLIYGRKHRHWGNL